MSAEVRPAIQRDIEPVCSLLHEKMNSRIPVSRWRNLMQYHWLSDKPDFGRVVESEGRILGFCGMVYADRLIGDASSPAGLRCERIVSMSSWYLDKSLRGKGLGRGMLQSAIADRSLTYATLTNSRKPLGIVEALGFRVLEDHRYVWRKTGVADPELSIIRQPDELRARANTDQRQLLDDMHGLPLMPVMIEYKGSQALMFFSVKQKGADITWFDIMYSSDLPLLADCAQLLANCLLPDDVSSVLAADGRFIPHSPTGAVVERLPVSRYFISESVEPCELDNLYSELQLLDLKLD